MLARRHSLRSARLFNRVFRKNRSFPLGEMLVLLGADATETGACGTHIGITFQTKAFPRAHTRHAYKRRILTALRPHLEKLPEGHIVILFRRRFSREDYAVFQNRAQALVTALAQHSK